MIADDLAAIDAAILALATGERVIEARIEGQLVRYGEADLPQLRALRSEVAHRLQGGGRIRYATQTGKGL